MKLCRLPYLVVSAILLCGTVAAGCGNNKKTDGKSSLPETSAHMTVITISDTPFMQTDTLVFGRLKEGETLLKEIAIENRRTEPLIIMNIDAGCGCLLFEYSRRPIAPGSSAIVKMRLYSSGLYGNIRRTAKIYFSGIDKPVEIPVTATVFS